VPKDNLPRLLLALILVLTVACVLLWWRSTRRLALVAEWVRHSQQVEQRLDSLEAAMTELESGARGYVLTGEGAFREEELMGEHHAQERLADLRLLTSDSPLQQSTLDDLSRLIDAKLNFSRDTMAARDAEGLRVASAVVATRRGMQLMAPANALLERMRDEDKRVRTARLNDAELARRHALILGVLTFALLVTACISFVLLLRAERRVRHAAAEKTREADERLRLLLGAVRDYAILALDPGGVIQTAAGATTRIFGRDPTGDHVRSLYPPEAAAMRIPERDLEATAKAGRSHDSGQRMRSDGSLFWADVVTTAIRDGRGELRGFARVVRDATAQKRIDDALRQSARQLEASNRELQDFALVASHDLQEPLRKVQMFGDKLRRKYAEALGEEGRDWLQRMTNAAMRGQSLIQGLLAFSRVTTKAQAPVRVDLSQTAREVTSDLEARIADAGGQVDIGDLPVLEADPLQMRQLLQNLIGNALKFRKPDQPPLVRLRARRFGHDGYEIEVSDNGIGFEQKYVDRIFKLFQRVHGRDAFEGSGMGLAICRKIVERHGGRITARSAPGEGTTFFIDLPAQQQGAAH
jgi:PAS domain S-box-containing protein